jgi:hypothetical protein
MYICMYSKQNRCKSSIYSGLYLLQVTPERLEPPTF